MARRLRGSFPARGFPSQRRLTAWELGTGGSGATAISSTGSTFIGAALGATVDGLTVIRIRGFWSVRLTLATSSLDGMTGAFAIGLATDAAVTAGVASVPTPITEQASENYLYVQYFEVKGAQAFSSGGAPGTEQFGTYLFFEIDSKAMRKMSSDDALYSIVEVGSTIGTTAIQVHHDSRALVKLP